ncbi:MAG: MASE1 domain-containing protein, partial [Xanthobacteraceae bacterium]
MTRFAGPRLESLADLRGLATYALELVIVGAAYFVLAKVSLALDALQPGDMPIWPATGFALAAVLLRGYRVWPAIFMAAWIASATTGIAGAGAGVAGSLATAAAIAAGNTLAALAAGYLIDIWSGGLRTFDTPAGVAKFAFVAVGPSTMIGATVGVGSLWLAGSGDGASLAALWVAWWLRDVVGVLLFAPVVVFWVLTDLRTFKPGDLIAPAIAYGAAIAVGLIALSPLLGQGGYRSALAFLAVLPLLWAALRCDRRDTATTALILSCFAAWGASAGGGPFAATPPDDSFLPLVMFMVSASVLSLALSADVTARNRIAATLGLQEQNLRALFSHAAIGIAQVDTAGRFRLVNDGFCEIVRRPAADILQMRMHDLVGPDDQSGMVDLLGRAFQSAEGFAAERRHVLPDGSPAWVRLNVAPVLDQGGAVRHLVVAAEDVTARRHAEDELQKEVEERTATLKTASEVLHTEIEQRKRVEDALKLDIAERRKAQEALMESEWRFRLVIQGVTDYAIFMLDTDGNITHWNMGAQRIHQYTAAEITGQHFSRFYTEEERQRGEPARALQVAAYEGKHAVEGRRVRRDESEFWAGVVIEAIRDEVGTLVGFANITRDITERREAQASLERAQEQLAQSQKMEALGQLTGSIAHDFNNLLMIVSGHAQLLRRRLTDPKHLQAIEAVHSAANRGESLTRQLLAFSRRQPLNPVVADLKERIAAVHEMLVGSLRGNVELKCDISEDVWPVEVDVAELELALVNVAVNARDAMPGGGSITLSARNVTLKKSDGVDQLEGDFVALAMTDTGVGIAPDVLPRIFEPFFTTKALGKGTGLGLSQVYGFSHQSGGTVAATSNVGSGTAITIYLPRREAATVAAVEAPS